MVKPDHMEMSGDTLTGNVSWQQTVGVGRWVGIVLKINEVSS